MTESKVDSMFSKLVRTVYPRFCHGVCEKNGKKVYYNFDQLQCAHRITRSYRNARFSLYNVAPCCSQCNQFVPEHVDKLYEHLCNYYGQERIDQLEFESRTEVNKISNKQLVELYTMFSKALVRAERIINGFEEDQVKLVQLAGLRELIIQKQQTICKE